MMPELADQGLDVRERSGTAEHGQRDVNGLAHLANQVEIITAHLPVPIDVVQNDLTRAERLDLACEADRVR